MGNSIQDDLFGADEPAAEATGGSSDPEGGGGLRRFMAPLVLGLAALLVLVG
ncbi:hypothetical protein [Kocuria atrinae]|uniref:hypothetical protein n=1 Tax=Kocuria atrinae TaxID=592377 RepID=UPI0002DCC882|nr:hypothetical protein [Kocuria atrinae]